MFKTETKKLQKVFSIWKGTDRLTTLTNGNTRAHVDWIFVGCCRANKRKEALLIAEKAFGKDGVYRFYVGKDEVL